jgi:lysophospholipase L1-like esterase
VNLRRVGIAYRVTAIIVLNVIVLLVLAESTATVLLRIARSPIGTAIHAGATGRPADLVGHYASLPYYTAQTWTRRYWQEHEAALAKDYHPYVIWRSPAFDGALLTIEPPGVRHTPGAECVPGAPRVFLFGGSAMWGWGAPDWETIPAHLQRILRSESGGPVCLVNYAENAYVSTQSLIQLLLLIEAGDVPDAVIFYDGVNDVLAARQSGRAIVHQNLAEIAARVRGGRHPLLEWLSGWNVVTVMQHLEADRGLRAHGAAQISPGAEVDRLAQSVTNAYLSAYRIVGALAELHGFEYEFFWQPHLLVGAKPLTPEEERMKNGGLDWILRLDPALRRLFEETYAGIAAAAAEDEHLHYLGDIFDRESAQIWIDTWGHVTPAGNALVAKAIADTVTRHGFKRAAGSTTRLSTPIPQGGLP